MGNGFLPPSMWTCYRVHGQNYLRFRTRRLWTSRSKSNPFWYQIKQRVVAAPSGTDIPDNGLDLVPNIRICKLHFGNCWRLASEPRLLNPARLMVSSSRTDCTVSDCYLQYDLTCLEKIAIAPPTSTWRAADKASEGYCTEYVQITVRPRRPPRWVRRRRSCPSSGTGIGSKSTRTGVALPALAAQHCFFFFFPFRLH
jgi:hypothetical protein